MNGWINLQMDGEKGTIFPRLNAAQNKRCLRINATLKDTLKAMNTAVD